MSQRIVVITGATGGLGGAIVDAFQQTGDVVVPVSRSAAEYPADLTDRTQAEAVIQRIAERYGRIDVLVHTMGAFAGGSAIPETSQEVWDHMLSVNFQAALYVCRSVVPLMTSAGTGRIIAIGSRVGVQPAAGLSAYGVSKAALNALIQTVASEVKDKGVTANVVLPSTIDTEANRRWGSPEQIALWVKPASIAEVIVWLASAAAGDVNGALIPVYGRA